MPWNNLIVDNKEPLCVITANFDTKKRKNSASSFLKL